MLTLFICFHAQSCFYHPLFKPYFFPEKSESSDFLLLLGGAFFLNQVQITSISKTSGVEGDTITIEGINFSANAFENSILFTGSIPGEIVSASETSISVRVPLGAKSGSIVINTTKGSAQSADSFTVYRYFITFSAGTNTETFTLDINSGAVAPIVGSPYSLNIPLGAKFSQNGKYAYSGNFGGATTIQSYSTNPLDGRISLLNATAGTTTQDPVFFAFHPNGKYLYVSNVNGGTVTAFNYDSNTGILTQISDYNPTCGCTLNHLVISPDGRFLFVNGNGGGEPILGFSIDLTTGILTNIPNSPFTTGIANMEAILIDSSSQFLYSVAASNSSILNRNINQTTGELTPIPGAPSVTGTPNNFRAVMHPSGKFLYTVNIAGATLAKHDIASDGSLSLPNSTLNFGSNLQFVSLDPTGAYGFVSNTGGNNFYVFKVDSTTGAPTLLNSGNPYPASAGNNSVPEAYRIAQ
ncbi:MAG: beta-propeller fold lactonase family protein [Leptospira sp.]|nr:beta-propeller fold lactonase family protein [Leptospira sp.]